MTEIIAPGRYRYLRTIAAIARDQVEGTTRWMPLEAALYWQDHLARYGTMLNPAVMFSDFMPPDVMVVFEQTGDNIISFPGYHAFKPEMAS